MGMPIFYPFSFELFFEDGIPLLKESEDERKLRVGFASVIPGLLQNIFERLHAVQAGKGWNVIRQFNHLRNQESSFVGIKKGPLILEIAMPPELATPEED